MKNYVGFANDNISNKAVLTIVPDQNESKYERDREAKEVSKRFLQSAALLPDSEFLGWQIETDMDNARCFVFSSSGTTVTEDDINWIFTKCAAADVKSSAQPRNIYEDNRRVYTLTRVLEVRRMSMLSEKRKTIYTSMITTVIMRTRRILIISRACSVC